MIKGGNIYSVNAEANKERHAEYCQNIVDVPFGSYLSTVIGEDYKSWQLGDDIWLSTSCGSGKTTFVMNIIEYFISQGFKILYIYADTKEHGYELQSKIPDSAFIFSEDRDNKLTDDGKEEKISVVAKKMFKHRVLIATSILDCGTSINDKEVKHVVINSIDPVTTMQFVGRIRRNVSPLNIYFNDRSAADIAGRLRSINTDINLANALVSNSGNRRSNDRDGYARMLQSSRINDRNKNLLLNKLANDKVCSLKACLMYLVDPNRGFGDKVFLEHQLKLFGFKLDECHDLGVDKMQKAISDTSALIDTVVGKELSESEYRDFGDKLDDLLIRKYGSTIIRKGHIHTPKTYNGKFADKGIPYELICKSGDKGKLYIFRKVQGTDKEEGVDNGAV